MKNKIILAITMIIACLMLSGCNIIRAETPDETDSIETTEGTTVTTTGNTEPAVSEAPVQTTAKKEEDEFIDYIMGDVNIMESDAEVTFNQLIANNVIGEEVYMLGWSAEAVSDGIHSVKDGLIELYHIEGTLDISLPFTDILNQKSEQEQIDTLTAIANAYKDAFNVDVVRIKCNGESIITDEISYDEIVQEEIEKLLPDDEDVESDEAYEEEE